ncbi:MAG: hypothetical protein Q4F03_04355 [Eubacteriales bacterium]|nr:hypothetical protein [Eubacteriales bacterium]
MKKRIWMALAAAGCVMMAPMTVMGGEEAGISGDIYSFQMDYDGEIFQLPMAFSELTERGWQLSKYDDPKMKVGTNSYAMVGFVKGDLELRADVINFGINEAPLEECLIGGLTVDASYSEMDFGETPVQLPGGILMGSSNLDDIKAAYGEPSDIYEGDNYVKVTYERDSYQDVELYVYKEKNALLQASMRNFAEPEDFDKGSVSTEAPDIVAAYKAPTEPGKDFMDPVVEYFGDLYRLPAPVSAFTANGWELKDVEEGAFAEGGGLEFIEMMKENQTVRFGVYNLTENAVTIENCFVTELKHAEYDPEVLAMKLAGDVSLGAERENLIALAKEKGFVCELDEEGSYLTIYKDKETKLETRLEVWFNKDKSKSQAASLTYRNEILPE